MTQTKKLLFSAGIVKMQIQQVSEDGKKVRNNSKASFDMSRHMKMNRNTAL